MIERRSSARAEDDRFRRPLWLGLSTVLLALSACVSDADPREGNREPPDGRADSVVRDGGVGDSARADAQDRSVTDDADETQDGSDGGEESSTDAASDVTNRDASDATDGSDVGDTRVPDA